ncbi:MAG TPA: hypothetical protein VMW08_18475 [Acidimicrobiales bacterium]|nr:hypothetical protein [Acidimicrobiales bacterium]
MPTPALRHNRLSRWLVVVACIVMFVATLTTWLQRQALSTDAWVEATDELLADDEVRAALAVFLVDELYKAVDVENAVADLLPADFDNLAPILASSIRQPATDAVDELLATDQAKQIWSTVSRDAHELLIAVLGDDSSAALSAAGGKVTIDLRQLVEQLAQRVGLSGDRIAQLPDGTGVVTLFESDQLEQAQDLVRTVERAATVLTIVVLALFGAAIWFSADRRRTLRNIGVGFALVGFLVLVARIFGIGALAGSSSTTNGEPASSVLNIGTSLLRQTAFTEFVIGLLLIAFAVLVGPTAAATRVREFVSPAMRFGPASAIGGGIVLALAVSWFRAPGPGATWLPIIFFFAICLGGAAWLQRVTLDENPA